MEKNRGPAQRNILILMEWHDHRIRQGIGEYARVHEWHLTVDERALIPRGWVGDGVLTVFHHRKDIARFIRQLKIPVVDMGLYRPDIPLPRVTGDHTRIGRLAAEHFAERGFRHTAWFSADLTPIHILRFNGFAQGCRDLKLETPLKWIWSEKCGDKPDNWKRMRRWLERLLRNSPKPLAVFAHNDYEASKVEDACRVAGVGVPEDISILGVDDNSLVCLNQPVPLSSIIHDLTRVGHEAAALIDRLIDGSPPPCEPVLIPPASKSFSKYLSLCISPFTVRTKDLFLCPIQSMG
ncbi:MAG: XylR family transcriptional regulator [Kiritimatiellae bacterium]|nr:XylR family transcriptional regulator [Kiritimatiellia bacterium]